MAEKADKLATFFKSFAENDEQLEYRLAHETVGERVPVISTGSLVLNDALSSGGLPRGRVIQYYGFAGSGKTFMAMLSIKEAQELDASAQQVFIDAEQTFDPSWAEIIGIDTSRIILVEGDLAVNGRRCFELLLGVPKENAKHILSGKSKKGMLDLIAEGELNINLIVLDSLGSIIPPGEDTSAVGKMNMSLLSRFLTTTFRKLSLELSKAKIPFIVINHKKDSMNMYGPDHTYSGGNTYTHLLSANIYFEALQNKDSTILDEEDNKIGHAIRATIEKSKFGPYPRKCDFKVVFNKGIHDIHEEIAALALKYNVVQKTSTVSHEYMDQKWVGYNKFCDAIKNDPSLASELQEKILKAQNLKFEELREEQQKRKQIIEQNIEKKFKKQKKEEEIVND